MDINLTQLQSLIHIAENATIDELEINDGVQNIRIVCRAPAHPAVPTPLAHTNQGSAVNAMTNPANSISPMTGLAAISNTTSNATPKTEPATTTPQSNSSANSPANSLDNSQATITAPMIGTFYLRANPEAAAFVAVNDSIATNQTLCIIEAMKIMHEVKAEKSGKITQILATEGDMVEYGQPLFIIE